MAFPTANASVAQMNLSLLHVAGAQGRSLHARRRKQPGAGETEAGAARRCERVGHRVTCSPHAGSERRGFAGTKSGLRQAEPGFESPFLCSSSGASKGPGLGY